MKKITIFLILLVIVTFSLRLFWIDFTILEGDMFRDFEIAENIIDGQIKYTGVSGINQAIHQQSFGPIMYYILAILIYLFKSPIAPAVFVAILNSIAVLITYKFCKDYFNKRIGVIASFLYAVNPWSVYISHFHWNPNYLPVFSVLFFYFLFGFIIKKKNYCLILASLILGIMLNFHLTALFFIPIAILLILVFRRKINIKTTIYSILTFLIPFLPYIYFNLKNNISLLAPILYGVSSRAYSGLFTGFTESFGIPIMLATNYLGSYVYGSSNIFLNPIIKYLFFSLTIVLVILIFLSLFYLIIKLKNSKFDLKNNLNIWILLIFLSLFPLLYFLRLKDVSPHYFFLIYPLQFIMIALFLDFLIIRYSKFRKVINYAIIVIIIFQVINIFLLFNYVNQNGSTQMGEFSIPYKHKIEILNYIKQSSGENTTNIIVYKEFKSFKYLADREITKLNYNYINSTEELDGLSGYLILDRTSMHKPELSREDELFFNNYPNKTIIKGVEIYEF
ncbi:glycosyltransferase family 39 protein [Candidatus Woesearchaeota archaeon]|nr:glycosyltransferase family 39 protein [Candidatus Woesearchaeota archaeon]